MDSQKEGQKLRIIHQDGQLVAIDKPAGFHVHPPEDERHRIPNSINCLWILRNQLGSYVYPVHRLDRATSGVLLFARSSEAARAISEQFKHQLVRKEYYAMVRGWTDPHGTIDHPLGSERDPRQKLEAKTHYERVATLELPQPVGRYPTARYSLVRIRPQSGRMHQIRRHFAHISHPLVGDSVYGDGQHNRFFTELQGKRTLFLKAYSLEITHPASGQRMLLTSRWGGTWHQVFDLFGVCPLQEIKPLY